MDKKKSGGATALRVIATLAILLVAAAYLPLTIPKIFGLECFAITSGSMEPEITTGSVVYAEETDPAALRAGDVIVFRSGSGQGQDATVTHRVVENHTEERELITKGDANDTLDLRPVPYDDVIGYVTRHIPVLGRIALILETWQGKLGSAAVLLLAVGLYAAGSKRKSGGSEMKAEGE